MVVKATLEKLQQAGHEHRECVVLWLGRQQAGTIDVERVFVPPQEAAADFFHIPPEGIVALFSHLRDLRLMVAAQVHAHPAEAFHSLAEDTWAIVRHVGALSLVLPFFGLHTTLETFMDDAAVFMLCIDNRWRCVLPSQVSRYYRVQP